MEKIIEQIINRLNDLEKRVGEIEINARPIGRGGIQRQNKKQTPDDLILSIINKVGECDESEKLQSKILDHKGMEAKILLCFYISYKYFKNDWLTTGDIEEITSGLGTKIAVGNVSNKIKSNLRQYLESRSVRKKGSPTPYRLNRKGDKYFESLLSLNEAQQ